MLLCRTVLKRKQTFSQKDTHGPLDQKLFSWSIDRNERLISCPADTSIMSLIRNRLSTERGRERSEQTKERQNEGRKQEGEKQQSVYLELKIEVLVPLTESFRASEMGAARG